MSNDERRILPPRRQEDIESIPIDDIDFIIARAVKVTLASYEQTIDKKIQNAINNFEHECIMNIGDSDVPYIRELVTAIKEVGDGSFPKAIAIIRDNHKFLAKINAVATKVGWGVFALAVTIFSVATMVVTDIIKHKTGQ